ncbi:hypothetical protein quinque_008268 [Culex quinquefasciatus]
MKRFKRTSFNYKNQHSKIIEDDIPAFWLTEFKNTRTVVDMFQPHDEPVLAHLTNVDIVYKTNLMCYVIEFHFLPFFRYRSCVQEDEKNVEDETQMLLTSDFEIGHFLRARKRTRDRTMSGSPGTGNILFAFGVSNQTSATQRVFGSDLIEKN